MAIFVIIIIIVVVIIIIIIFSVIDVDFYVVSFPAESNL